MPHYSKKQILSYLGVLILLSAIPITLYALTLPVGIYDLRKKAAEEPAEPSKAVEYVPGQIIVKPKEGISERKIEQLLEKESLTVKNESKQTKVKILKVKPHSQNQKMKRLLESNYFEYVENDYIAKIAVVPNDVDYPKQWGLKKIAGEQGWDISPGSSQIVIAVVDSGIDSDHPDLSSKIITGYNLIDGTSNTDDDYGHGTHVAGIASAVSNNALGVAGTAWGSKLLPIKVFDAQTGAWYSRVANGIIYATDHGASVINLSLGNYPYSSFLEEAVNYAASRGVAIVGAAGNNNYNSIIYPAAFTKAIAVGATDQNDLRASFSNYGEGLDVTAPGVSIYSTYNNGNYTYMSGTSMAAPFVSDLMSLIFAVNNSLDLSQARTILEQSADDLGGPMFDIYYGWGRINIYKTLVKVSTEPTLPDTTNPTVVILTPGNDTTVSGNVEITAEATDNVGVTHVEFYVNGALYGSDPAGPYIYVWDTTLQTDNNYELITKAYDNAGNVGTSAPVSVATNNVSDKEAPKVSIIQPEEGSTVLGTTLIEAVATDNIAVVKVEFFIDDLLKGQDTDSPFAYIWETENYITGIHRLTAKAYDRAENVGVSPLISVVVDSTADVLPPSVVITSPAEGSTLSADKVKIMVTASDNRGVTKVEIYLDGKQVKTLRRSPYEWEWGTRRAEEGYHIIEAKAYDSSANQGTDSIAVYLVKKTTRSNK